jgi:hypothetical protein
MSTLAVMNPTVQSTNSSKVRALLELLQADEPDLERNRRRRLGVRQRVRLFVPLAALTLFSLFAFWIPLGALFTFLDVAFADAKNTVLFLALLVGLGSFSAVLAKYCFSRWLELVRGRADMVEGVPVASTERFRSRTNRLGPLCRLRFPSEELALPARAAAMLEPATTYRAYFTPFTKILLSLEPLQRSDNEGATTTPADPSPPSLTDGDRALLGALATNEDELDENRRGFIVLRQQFRLWFEYFVFPVLAIGMWIPAAFVTASIGDLFTDLKSVCALPVAWLLGSLFTVMAWPVFAELVEGRVCFVDGVVGETWKAYPGKSEPGFSGAQVCCYMRLDGDAHAFALPNEAYELIKRGAGYRVYFTPYTELAVAMEEQPSVVGQRRST